MTDSWTLSSTREVLGLWMWDWRHRYPEGALLLVPTEGVIGIVARSGFPHPWSRAEGLVEVLCLTEEHGALNPPWCDVTRLQRGAYTEATRVARWMAREQPGLYRISQVSVPHDPNGPIWKPLRVDVELDGPSEGA